MMKPRLQNKVALITGGNSGIGRATAQRFVEEGARVVITGRNQKTIDETVAQLGADQVDGVRADAADVDDIRRVMASVREKHSRLDVLFLNAGIAPLTPLGGTDEKSFDGLFAINVKGVYFSVQEALPLFGENGGSVIITSSAVNAKGMANMSAYAATKAAVRSLARSFSAELQPKGIRVNCVSPGPIETPIFGRLGLPDDQAQGMAQQITKMTPAGHFGQAIDIADCVVYLASDESRYVLGADFAVDGGFAQI
jgi:NAD(P)-dependent dehydrogenase (short-subunit alcohol dehydrogenase family)